MDKFRITKHKDGKYPAIITISGFTSEDIDNRKTWQNSISTLYPENEWFHLEWNSKKLPFRKEEMTSMPSIHEIKKTRKPKHLRTLITAVFRTYTFIPNIVINNFWHVSVRNSKVTGRYLASVLNACEKKEFILIGHSLGARIIFNCLEYLHENKLNANISEVHLLGGVVGSNNTKWLKTSEKVKNNIYNYSSDNDYIIRTLYRIGMLTAFPIGITTIENKKVVNKDVTSYVSEHSNRIENFHKSRYYNIT